MTATSSTSPDSGAPHGIDHVELRGLRVAYRRAGDGPPLVLLHGFVGDSREWRRQIQVLSDEFTVVAWDAPGSGESSDPPPTWRMPEYADCLAEFVATLGLGRPHVMGLSFGGALALELYRRHPAIPRSLVLAAAYAGWTGSLPPGAAETRLQASVQLAEQPPAAFTSAMIPTLFSGSAAADRVAEFAAIVAEFHPAGFPVMARSLAEADLRDVLPRITIPTLLLSGDQDVRAPLYVGADLDAAIPGSRLVVLRGVGHMINVEAAEGLNTEVRAFLSAVPG